MTKTVFFFFHMLFATVIARQVHAQAKPGDIAPNAKVLDVDELHPFSDGVAVIKKGTTTALIDPSGNFIVPFGKYIIKGPSKSGLLTVFCPEDDGRTPSRKGLINTKGTLVLPCNPPNVNSPLFNFEEKGYARVITDAGTFFINAKGEKIKFQAGTTYKPVPSFYHEGLGSFSVNGKYGYLDHSGKTIITPQFDAAGAFSEGLAVAGKKNEYGEIKYGFIDKVGNVVIPFQYSNQPKDFSNGLAGVEPVKKDAFSFVYINKKGEIVITIDKAPDGSKLLPPSYGLTDFKNGFVTWRTANSKRRFSDYLIDTTGKMMNIEDFLQRFGIDVKDLYMAPNVGANQDILVLMSKSSGKGLLNLKANKTIPYIFRRLDDSSYDPGSKLMYAEMDVNPPTQKKSRKGYINEDGIFVIVKGEESVF